MITFDDPTKPAPTTPLDSDGGFVWWYLEILNEDLDGLVMIWSFGLPFLPGYTSAARRGRGVAARKRPSLNIAVYRNGKPDYYVLREFDPHEVEWDGAHNWRFGQTRIEGVVDGTSGRRRTSVFLDCPVDGAGARITGRVTVEGPIPREVLTNDLGLSATHAWTPLAAPARGQASLSLGGGRAFNVSGHAYHDRNASDVGLHALGIDRWAWGHTLTAEGCERIFYVLWPEGSPTSPETFGLEIAPDGSCSRVALTAVLEGARRTIYGMQYWEKMALYQAQGERLPWMSMELSPRQRVDNGPFYLRYLTRVAVDNSVHATPGSLELITPSRIDLDRHRFLVQMRVARPRGNSLWLPLFQGDRSTRMGRMARRLTSNQGNWA